MQTHAMPQVQKPDLRKLPALSKNEIPNAELPERYKAARKALQDCWRIDELKDISDKHSAIAHYAKQAKDESLLYYAKRIQLRAFERIGELLYELNGNYDERRDLAKQQGVAVADANRAYESVHAPKRVRDTLIEASPPPSKMRLAECGRGYIPRKGGGPREGFRRYLEAEERVKHTPRGQVEEMESYLGSIKKDLRDFLGDGVGGAFTMTELGRAVHPEEAGYYRENVVAIIELLDEFEQALPKES